MQKIQLPNKNAFILHAKPNQGGTMEPVTRTQGKSQTYSRFTLLHEVQLDYL